MLWIILAGIPRGVEPCHTLNKIVLGVDGLALKKQHHAPTRLAKANPLPKEGCILYALENKITAAGCMPVL